jgi:hypothetical protein
VASVPECLAALGDLAARLDGLDPQLRAKHLPSRSVSCVVRDLDCRLVGTLGSEGLAGVREADDDDPSHRDADVRIGVDSDELVRLAQGDGDLLSAWARGRVTIAAPWRDLLKLRALAG